MVKLSEATLAKESDKNSFRANQLELFRFIPIPVFESILIENSVWINPSS